MEVVAGASVFLAIVMASGRLGILANRPSCLVLASAIAFEGKHCGTGLLFFAWLSMPICKLGGPPSIDRPMHRGIGGRRPSGPERSLPPVLGGFRIRGPALVSMLFFLWFLGPHRRGALEG